MFLVTRNNDGQGFGRLVGSLNADQSELLAPIALDVKKRRVFHYDEMKCIRNCSYNLHRCQVLILAHDLVCAYAAAGLSI